MLKYFISILLLTACPLTSALADQTVYQEENFSYILTNEGAILTDWLNWTDAEVQPTLAIPDSLGGTPVVGIGSGALATCLDGPYFSDFEIIIPEGVTFLEESAFECCSNANSIYLPSTLNVIPEGSFMHVGADIVFPNGNPCFTVENGFLVNTRTQTLLYSSCSSRGKQLPLVKRLGAHCLDNWLYNVEEPLLPDSLLSIGSGVFYDLPDLKRISLPAGITSIDSNCFVATGLQEVNIPSSLTEIPSYCFNDCYFSTFVVPDGVERIGEYAFKNNWYLTDVTIAESVQFVGYNAFPEEIHVVALSPTTHFETLEEYQIRCPDGEW